MPHWTNKPVVESIAADTGEIKVGVGEDKAHDVEKNADMEVEEDG